MRARWEHFPHEADVGIRGVGATREAAFEQAGLALTAVIADPAEVRPLQKIELRCDAPDDEALLVDWLNELIFAMTTRHLVFARFAVRIAGTHLEGDAWGEPLDVARHQPAAEPKGATYTALKVRRADGEWIAQCVVDV